MPKDDRVSNSDNWTQSGLVDTCVLRGVHHYSVPHAISEVRANVSPAVAASVEEKVSELIRSYPHLAAFLKSHSRGANARIRDLAISSKERDQLLYQIIAARRQQLLASGRTEGILLSVRGSRFRIGVHGLRRKR